MRKQTYQYIRNQKGALVRSKKIIINTYFKLTIEFIETNILKILYQHLLILDCNEPNMAKPINGDD